MAVGKTSPVNAWRRTETPQIYAAIIDSNPAFGDIKFFLSEKL